MGYTPRQVQAFCFIAGRRRLREMGEALHLNTLAARGEEKSIREQLREWDK